MLILSIGSVYAGSSQSIDTLCFPIKEAREVLTAAKQKKVLDSLVIVLNNDIKSYEVVVRELQGKDSVNKEIVNTYKAMIETMKEQRLILENQITDLNKEIKRWKRKNRWTAIAGVVTTVGGIVATIFLTK